MSHDDDSDGVSETFNTGLRVTLTLASQMAASYARQREAQLRVHEALAVQEAKELEARFESERAIAQAALADVHTDRWWDNASTSDIGFAWQNATAWREQDDTVERAARRMEDELGERYGISRGELLHMTSEGKARDVEARLKVAETQIRSYGNEADSEAANAQRIVAGNNAQTTSQGLQASRRRPRVQAPSRSVRRTSRRDISQGR